MRRLIRIDAQPRANPRACVGHGSFAADPLVDFRRSVAAAVGWAAQPPEDQASTAGRARPSADFELIDARTGQLNRLSDYQGRVLVIVFVGTSCPVGDLYMPRLVELSKRYEIAECRLSGDQFQRERLGRGCCRLCPAIAERPFPS